MPDYNTTHYVIRTRDDRRKYDKRYRDWNKSWDGLNRIEITNSNYSQKPISRELSMK